ncbi:MAG TPA: 4'-phosphopantetheinyl transferase superfamily protein [Caldimonas sp.]|nr:4'-phosphopantetheinyl transferase superfamily protein [Caldimonas sp.]
MHTMRMPLPQVTSAPVDVHWFDLRDPSLLASGELGPDEERRAASVRTVTLWRRYVASHVALRRLLATRLGVPDPRRVALSWHRGVKPVLCMPSTALTFSLTRSGDVAAVALGDGVEVGIDVEADNTIFESLEDRQALLTPSEQHALTGMAHRERARAAQRLWVRKEALLKAIGTGFVTSPAWVSAGTPRGRSGVQVWGTRTVRWMDLPSPPGHAAAAAWCEVRRTAGQGTRLGPPESG